MQFENRYITVSWAVLIEVILNVSVMTGIYVGLLLLTAEWPAKKESEDFLNDLVCKSQNFMQKLSVISCGMAHYWCKYAQKIFASSKPNNDDNETRIPNCFRVSKEIRLSGVSAPVTSVQLFMNWHVYQYFTGSFCLSGISQLFLDLSPTCVSYILLPGAPRKRFPRWRRRVHFDT